MAGRPRTQLKKVTEFCERARQLWQDYAELMPSQYQDESKCAGPTGHLWFAANTELCAAMTTLEFLEESLNEKVRRTQAGASDVLADSGTHSATSTIVTSENVG